MAKLEKYLRLDPDGTLSWITIDRDHFLDGLYQAIGCTSVEHVSLRYGLECIVDESGWYSEHQVANLYASPLYHGWARGIPLIGPVVFVDSGWNDDGDLDWFPLRDDTLLLLSLKLCMSIPVREV